LLKLFFERWQEIALLVFRALALSVGKNQMCNLCGWLFFQLAPNVLVYGVVATKTARNFELINNFNK
jgi:hypothetical protein